MNILQKISMAVAMAIPATSFAAFSDTVGNPYEPAINYVQQKGIVSGYADGTFKAYANINRAEFTKILVGAAGVNVQAQCRMAAFPDASMAAWYGPYVHAAKCTSLVSGYADGTFKPANNINFAEASKIVSLAFDLNVQPTGSVWYQQYFTALDQINAMPSPRPAPDQLVTRGQMAEMIYRVLISSEITADTNTQPSSVSSASSSAISSPSSSVEDTQDQSTGNGQYTDYAEGVIGNGQEAVLFFYASWCPSCQANDQRLQDWYASEDFPLSVYKIDFDERTDLRSQFGVTGQDTFIKIDAEGNVVSTMSFPSESKLRDLVDG